MNPCRKDQIFVFKSFPSKQLIKHTFADMYNVNHMLFKKQCHNSPTSSTRHSPTVFP